MGTFLVRFSYVLRILSVVVVVWFYTTALAEDD